MIMIVDWIDLFLATIPRKKKKKRSHPLSMWLFSIPNMVNRQVSLYEVRSTQSIYRVTRGWCGEEPSASGISALLHISTFFEGDQRL